MTIEAGEKINRHEYDQIKDMLNRNIQEVLMGFSPEEQDAFKRILVAVQASREELLFGGELPIDRVLAFLEAESEITLTEIAISNDPFMNQ